MASNLRSELLNRHPLIAIDTHTLSGAPRIQGRRIAVADVLYAVLKTHSISDAAKTYSLSDEQVSQALEFAAGAMELFRAQGEQARGRGTMNPIRQPLSKQDRVYPCED